MATSSDYELRKLAKKAREVLEGSTSEPEIELFEAYHDDLKFEFPNGITVLVVVNEEQDFVLETYVQKPPSHNPELSIRPTDELRMTSEDEDYVEISGIGAVLGRLIEVAYADNPAELLPKDRQEELVKSSILMFKQDQSLTFWQNLALSDYLKRKSLVK